MAADGYGVRLALRPLAAKPGDRAPLPASGQRDCGDDELAVSGGELPAGAAGEVLIFAFAPSAVYVLAFAARSTTMVTGNGSDRIGVRPVIQRLRPWSCPWDRGSYERIRPFAYGPTSSAVAAPGHATTPTSAITSPASRTSARSRHDPPDAVRMKITSCAPGGRNALGEGDEAHPWAWPTVAVCRVRGGGTTRRAEGSRRHTGSAPPRGAATASQCGRDRRVGAAARADLERRC